MNRFFINPTSINGTDIQFPDDVAHQIRHVLRLRQDDLVEVLDNSGKIYRTKLDFNVANLVVRGSVVDIYEGRSEPKVQIQLYFGLTSREKVELILQKGTEAGVSVFQPFISDRTLTQTTTLTPKKMARWQRIIKEAAEQSHRSLIPQLAEPMTIEHCLQKAGTENELNLLAWENANTESQELSKVLTMDRPLRIGLFVGPEGGFSQAEANLAQESGCKIVSLGARILRMETAAILFPALVLYDLNAL